MSCRIITIAGEQKESQFFNDLQKVISEDKADQILHKSVEDDFINWYGEDWVKTGVEPTATNLGVQNLRGEIARYNDIIDNKYNTSEVDYSLKAINILQSDKAEQVFEKGEKNGWDLNRILTELQIPKEQKQIILDKNITNREEIITSLLANNSFVIEVNTATRLGTTIENPFTHDTPENTEYYSNLTVPGGTNYIEQNFETPLIKVPKSHAQFNTENTIGFSRSDDRNTYTENDIEALLKTMENSGVLKIKCS